MAPGGRYPCLFWKENCFTFFGCGDFEKEKKIVTKQSITDNSGTRMEISLFSSLPHCRHSSCRPGRLRHLTFWKLRFNVCCPPITFHTSNLYLGRARQLSNLTRHCRLFSLYDHWNSMFFANSLLWMCLGGYNGLNLKQVWATTMIQTSIKVLTALQLCTGRYWRQ